MEVQPAVILASGSDLASGLDVQHEFHDDIMPNHGSDGRSPKLDSVPGGIQPKNTNTIHKWVVSMFSAR